MRLSCSQVKTTSVFVVSEGASDIVVEGRAEFILHQLFVLKVAACME